MGKARALVALVVLSLGCDGGDEVTVSDQGNVCVLAQDEAARDPFNCAKLDFSADSPLTFSVDFGICLSSSCDSEARASCRASVEGSIVTVSAEGSYHHEGDECTEDCGSLRASCELELGEGDYEIRYAGKSMSWTLPSTRAKVCMDQDFPSCCDTDADCVEGFCAIDTLHCAVPE